MDIERLKIAAKYAEGHFTEIHDNICSIGYFSKAPSKTKWVEYLSVIDSRENLSKFVRFQPLETDYRGWGRFYFDLTELEYLYLFGSRWDRGDKSAYVFESMSRLREVINEESTPKGWCYLDYMAVSKNKLKIN